MRGVPFGSLALVVGILAWPLSAALAADVPRQQQAPDRPLADSGAAKAVGDLAQGPQLAQSVTAAQQQALDKIYAEAEVAAQGKSEAERKELFRATMPRVIEVLRPGARSTAYATLFAESAELRAARADLGIRMGFGGDIDFYP